VVVLSLGGFTDRVRIAYFSMEIALRPEIKTYSGGLGVLAGDTVRSCADLEIPVVFVTLVSRAGYFHQEIDSDDRQVEQPDWWQPAQFCTPLDAMVALQIEQRAVWIRPWLYIHTSPHGHRVPVLLLDSDLEQNDSEDRKLTHYLYGDGESYRLKQELILGLGGIRLLQALGFYLTLPECANTACLPRIPRWRAATTGFPTTCSKPWFLVSWTAANSGSSRARSAST
jgi:starch phosphorylase